jgi:protein O-mannosyl-transferase
MGPARAPMTRVPARRNLVFALIFAAALLAYLPAMRGGFVWDDAAHVTSPELCSLHGLGRIWFEVGATQQYYPVVFTAFWVEHRLWGDRVLGYHLWNVLLHATAACLVVLVARRLRIAGAGLAGLVFALHPVGVESVAWISEQKNTLSAVFYLSAAFAWLVWREGRPDEAGGAGPAPARTRRAGLYWLATGLFLLALFTKTVTATLPAALLVIAWWRWGRLSWRRDVRPLLPWLAAGIAAGCLTSRIEHQMMALTGVTVALTFLQRCLLAGRAIVFYLTKLIWPADLVFIYPRWTVDPHAAWQYLFPAGALALLAVLGWRWAAAGGQKRGLLAGFLFFAGTLFPALGFISAYPFRYSYVADHFQYLACLGIVVPAAAGWTALGANRAPTLGARRAWWAATAAVLAFLGLLTWRQCGMYRNLETLYRVTIQRNPGCWMARTNLGALLVETGRAGEAIPLLERAIQERPGTVETYGNLGNALAAVGRNAEAISEYERALRINPRLPSLEYDLGRALDRAGRVNEAIAHYERALQIDPDYGPAHGNLALDLSRAGRFAEAIGHYEAVFRHETGSADLHNACGVALLQTGRLPEAIAEFETAVRLNPASGDLHYNLAIALARAGRAPEAMTELRRALQLNPRLQPPPP